MKTTAEQTAKRDIAKEIGVFYPDPGTWDQFNATISHVFTKEARKLNRQLVIH
jgi:hypothetical protein